EDVDVGGRPQASFGGAAVEHDRVQPVAERVLRRLADAVERVAHGIRQIGCRGRCLTGHDFSDRLGRPSQMMNSSSRPAGMNGPHHAFNPIALIVSAPPLTSAMIVPAHANALARFSAVNLSRLTFATAHAAGMAVRRPGRKRLARMMSVSCAGT